MCTILCTYVKCHLCRDLTLIYYNLMVCTRQSIENIRNMMFKKLDFILRLSWWSVAGVWITIKLGKNVFIYFLFIKKQHEILQEFYNFEIQCTRNPITWFFLRDFYIKYTAKCFGVVSCEINSRYNMIINN